VPRGQRRSGFSPERIEGLTVRSTAFRRLRGAKYRINAGLRTTKNRYRVAVRRCVSFQIRWLFIALSVKRRATHRPVALWTSERCGPVVSSCGGLCLVESKRAGDSVDHSQYFVVDRRSHSLASLQSGEFAKARATLGLGALVSHIVYLGHERTHCDRPQSAGSRVHRLNRPPNLRRQEGRSSTNIAKTPAPRWRPETDDVWIYTWQPSPL
jgi:hypothetical protein